MEPIPYLAAQPYSTNHFLEPPRRAIPPPDLQYLSGEATFAVENIGPFEYASAEYGNPGFLKSINGSGALRLHHTMLVWKYEMRREAQHILPFLLLGPGSAARDINFVRDNGVTFLVAVRSAAAVKARPQFLNPTVFASSAGIEYIVVDLDSPYEMRTNLRPTIKAMNDHLERTCTANPITSFDDIKGKILVFCESGNERSTTLVAAYLMTVFGIDLIKAIQMIQSQRFCISPDDAMKEMLGDWDTYLQAERQVAEEKTILQNAMNQRMAPGVKILSRVTLNKSSKRNIDRAYESDEEMMDEDWNASKDGRTGRGGVAPFSDVIG